MREKRPRTNTPIEAIDATAQYIPEHITEDGLMRLDDLIWRKPEHKKEALEWVGTLWKELGTEISQMTGQQIPDFQPEMIQWVQYDPLTQANVLGDHNPVSGVIRLNAFSLGGKEGVAHTLAHELMHMASARKLLKREDKIIPVRSGLSILGNVLTRKRLWEGDYTAYGWSNEWSDEKSFELESYGLNILNEALVEITSSRVLNVVSPKIAGLENVQSEPTSYPEARRFYRSLVHNLVLAWNDPSLRFTTGYHISFDEETQASKASKEQNMRDLSIRLKEELHFGDTITQEDVEKLFEKTLWQKQSINQVARLINAMLGEEAFQSIYRSSSRLKPSVPEKGWSDYSKLWDIVSTPAEELVTRLVDSDIHLDDITIPIPKESIPDRVTLLSIERDNGIALGIVDTFKEYEKLLHNPISKADLLTTVVLAQRSIPSSTTKYPFDQTIVHIPREMSIIVPIKDVSLDFCFGKLLEALAVSSQPTTTVSNHILTVDFATQYYDIPLKPDVQLAKVTMTEGERTTTYYFFVK